MIEQMGLPELMERKCDYNVTLIQHFFATLVLGGDNARTMKWMTGSTPFEANFYDFAEILGYTFEGTTSVGHRLRPSSFGAFG